VGYFDAFDDAEKEWNDNGTLTYKTVNGEFTIMFDTKKKKYVADFGDKKIEASDKDSLTTAIKEYLGLNGDE
jgi:hypothetical protein